MPVSDVSDVLLINDPSVTTVALAGHANEVRPVPKKEYDPMEVTACMPVIDVSEATLRKQCEGTTAAPAGHVNEVRPVPPKA